MTKQGIDVSKWMRVKKNLKWYCGNDGKRNLVIDLLKRFDGHRTNPSPYAFYTQDLMRVLFCWNGDYMNWRIKALWKLARAFTMDKAPPLKEGYEWRSTKTGKHFIVNKKPERL